LDNGGFLGRMVDGWISRYIEEEEKDKSGIAGLV
jgi:hypothetical protein